MNLCERLSGDSPKFYTNIIAAQLTTTEEPGTNPPEQLTYLSVCSHPERHEAGVGADLVKVCSQSLTTSVINF